jgi:hypothetical protein
MGSGDQPPTRPRVLVQAPPPLVYVLGEDTITLPFPLQLDDLDRLLFLATVERAGSGRAAAKLLGRSESWAYERCFELDIRLKDW